MDWLTQLFGQQPDDFGRLLQPMQPPAPAPQPEPPVPMMAEPVPGLPPGTPQLPPTLLNAGLWSGGNQDGASLLRQPPAAPAAPKPEAVQPPIAPEPQPEAVLASQAGSVPLPPARPAGIGGGPEETPPARPADLSAPNAQPAGPALAAPAPAPAAVPNSGTSGLPTGGVSGPSGLLSGLFGGNGQKKSGSLLTNPMFMMGMGLLSGKNWSEGFQNAMHGMIAAQPYMDKEKERAADAERLKAAQGMIGDVGSTPNAPSMVVPGDSGGTSAPASPAGPTVNLGLKGAAIRGQGAVPSARPFTANPELAAAIQKEATAAGLNPVDLATAMSYETGGTFDPWKAGPRTQWGQHRGLIQWGEPQARQYGVSANTPVGDQVKAAIRYLQDRGVKPGMGLMDIYSAINAGGVGRYNASDAGNGGAPGTVADKVNYQMAGHRKKAEMLLANASASAPTVVNPAASASPVAAAAPAQTAQKNDEESDNETPAPAANKAVQEQVAKTGAPAVAAPASGSSGPKIVDPMTRMEIVGGGTSASDNQKAKKLTEAGILLMQSTNAGQQALGKQYLEQAQKYDPHRVLKGENGQLYRQSLTDLTKVEPIQGTKSEKLSEPFAYQGGIAQRAANGEIKWVVNPKDQKDDKAPSAVQEYNFYAKQEKAAGRAPKSYETWDLTRRRSQNDGTIGTIPQGYQLKPGESGTVSMAPIPGGPAEIEAKDKADKQAKQDALAKQGGNIVVEDIDRVMKLAKEGTLPITGGPGELLSRVPGTNAHDVAALLETIRTNAAFDRLQQMRAASPTGGALGAVSDQENRMLAAAIGNLGQSQSQEQFTRNLDRVKNIYLDIVHGPGNRPQAAAKAGAGVTHIWTPDKGLQAVGQ